jgi:hypothetical protein
VDFAKILEYFDTFENHHSYLIREKIYQGQGLFETKTMLEHVVEECADIQADVLVFHQQKLNNFLKDIEESIQIILSYSDLNLDFHEVPKYALLIQSLVEDLHKFISGLQEQTDSDIEEIELYKKEDELERLKFKFEDNIDQILKSFSWKEYESKILRTQADTEFDEFAYLLTKFNSSKVLGSQIPKKEYLDVLTRLTVGVRDIVVDNFEAVFTFIPLVEAVCKIFNQDQDIQLEENRQPITVEYIRQTINHFIGTNRIQWMGSFYETIMEDSPKGEDQNLHRVFADRLYYTTKDPKEYFLWTMSYYSRIHDDRELIQLSSKVANLTGTLLTIVDRLEKLDQHSIVASIVNLDSIGLEDAVNDLSEIYERHKDWLVLMKQALKSKLDRLKRLLTRILQFDEVIDDVLFMMQTLIPADHNLFPVTPENLVIVIQNY